jgi:5-(carboxyamino)imidazole ribonucleotide synthase
MGGRYVVKFPTGGYDGNGVFFVQNPEPSTIVGVVGGTVGTLADQIGYSPVKQLLIEDFADNAISEISVIVAIQNERTVYYDPVEMNFHATKGILTTTTNAWRLNKEETQLAIDTAIKAARSFGCNGLFAVEMFYCGCQGDNTFIVNEVAPRVHNSGHHTLQTHDISQFEM